MEDSSSSFRAGGANYYLYFDIDTRRTNAYKKEVNYSLNSYIDKLITKTARAGSWHTISQLNWKPLSEEVLTVRDVRFRINAIGEETLKSAFLPHYVELCSKIPHIDPLIAVQTIALGMDYYKSMLEYPDYIGFIEEELQAIPLVEMLGIFE